MNPFKRIVQYARKLFLQKKGWSGYSINHMLPELKNAYRSSTLPKEERKWAYDRGFYPWRIKQYGMTEDNYKSIISDKDYAYLYPLNNQYRIWIDDKLTMKYILAPFDEFLPEYYYHLMTDRGVMRLMNCPADCEASFDGVVSLLREKKLLAAKKAAGSLGVGFYRLEVEGDGFLANGKPYTESEFRRFLQSLNDYVFTEFIEMHPDLKKINPFCVNTLRVMVINETGNDPILPYAYFRIGTQRSGEVDNISRGGMVCKVDVKTGRFYDAEVLIDHKYQSETHHPDTGEALEGILPNWELVKQTLLEISKYCPQLTWLGYDIAITEDGFKIIEINSHQMIHKAHEYPPEVNRFLFSELEKKKKRIS
jgi:hypothetical protein